MRASGVRLALACSLLALSACNDRVMFWSPRFEMGPHDAQGLVVTPEGEVVEGGRLTVSIRGLLRSSERRALATLADVERVVVTVLASGQEFSQTVERAAILAGETSTTFTGIPIGSATVTMTAYDDQDRPIGQTSKSATVAAGASATVELQLQLTPTYTQPVSGGGVSTDTGSISANGTILDGPIVESPPPLPTGTQLAYFSALNSEVGLDAEGRGWMIDASGARLVQYASDGTELERLSIPDTHYGCRLFVDSSRRIWTLPSAQEASDGMLQRFAPDGTLTLQYPAMHFPLERGTPIVEDAQGNFWLNTAEYILKFPHEGDSHVGQVTFAPSGTALVQDAASMALDGNGLLNVLSFVRPSMDPGAIEAAWLTKHAADGTELSRVSVPLPPTSDPMSFDHAAYEAQIAISHDGTIWYSGRYSNKLYKLAPDGSLLHTFSLGEHSGLQAMNVDPTGHVWVSNTESLFKVSPDGQVLGTFGLQTPTSPACSQAEAELSPPTGIGFGGSAVWIWSEGGGCGFRALVLAR